MATLEHSKDKIQYICDTLKKETLEPAKQEGERIIANARAEAERILKEAGVNADKILEAGRECMEREKAVSHSSLVQGCKQSLEGLRQEIVDKLFNEELSNQLAQAANGANVIAELISTVVRAIEKEGMGADLEAIIPKEVPAQKVNELLAKGILERLRDQTVSVGSFTGGAKVKLHDKKLTIDISDDALKQLLAGYIQKDFRKLLFANQH